MLIEWQDSWLVGEERIDAEHLTLVSIINALYAAAERGADRDEVFALLLSLLERTKLHFSYEEQIMEYYDYPSESAHRKQHQRLLRVVHLLLQNVTGLDSEVILKTVGTFDEWFIAHVESDDAALGEFLKA